MYGPKSIWVTFSSLRGPPFHRLEPCSSLCLELPYGSLFLVKPTDKGLGFGIYLPRRVDTAVAFYKVSRADRRESCTRSWTGGPQYRELCAIIFFHLKLNFVLQFLITRRISGLERGLLLLLFFLFCPTIEKSSNTNSGKERIPLAKSHKL